MVITRQAKLNEAVIQQQSLELALKDSQLKQLLEQLNPHFMFNSINNIRALILKDANKARDMLANFADIMRYQINMDDNALVSLQDELMFVRDYVALVKLQMGKRLSYEETIDESLYNKRVVKMSLQLLVENAVKHGFSQSVVPGTLSVEVAADEKGWFILSGQRGYFEH